MSIVVSQVAINQEKPVDREKTCPFLLRVFCANGRHNNLGEYVRGTVPANELQMYTWLDCTLKELTSLIKEVNPDARKRFTNFDFAIVSPDKGSARYQMRDVGNTLNGQKGIDDHKTLAQCKIEIGDFIDVAITMPGAMGPRNGGRSFGYGGGPPRDFGGPMRDNRRQFSPPRDRGERFRDRD